MRKKLSIRALLLALLALTLVLAFTACTGAPAGDGGEGGAATEEGGEGGETGGEGGEASGEPIKIGAIFDLSGATGDVGTPYADGVRAYVDWINAQGGIEGRQLELIWQDYAYEVQTAEQLYSQFVTQDQVVAFQGWGTGDTEALRTRIAEDEIPFMSASYSAALANPSEAPYNFLIGVTYSDQFRIAIDYAIENSADGSPVIALLHNDSPFGLSPLEDGITYAEAKGAEVFGIPMPRGATDHTPELTQVQDEGAEFIVVQNVSSPAATLMKDVQRLGLDVQVICLNWCTDELFVNLAGDAAEGAIGTSPFAFPSADAEALATIREYAEANGQEIGVHYIQGWTTMHVMAEGIRRVLQQGQEVTGPNIRAALETLSNFDTGGVTAPITFTASNHAGSTSLRLYQVQGGEWIPLTDYLGPQQ